MVHFLLNRFGFPLDIWPNANPRRHHRRRYTRVDDKRGDNGELARNCVAARQGFCAKQFPLRLICTPPIFANFRCLVRSHVGKNLLVPGGHSATR